MRAIARTESRRVGASANYNASRIDCIRIETAGNYPWLSFNPAITRVSMFRRVIDSNETASATPRRATRGDRVPVFSDPFGRNPWMMDFFSSLGEISIWNVNARDRCCLVIRRFRHFTFSRSTNARI